MLICVKINHSYIYLSDSLLRLISYSYSRHCLQFPVPTKQCWCIGNFHIMKLSRNKSHIYDDENCLIFVANRQETNTLLYKMDNLENVEIQTLENTQLWTYHSKSCYFLVGGQTISGITLVTSHTRSLFLLYQGYTNHTNRYTHVFILQLVYLIFNQNSEIKMEQKFLLTILPSFS